MGKPNVFVVESHKLVMLGIPKVAQTSIKRAFLGPEVENVHDKRHFQYLDYKEVKAFENRGYISATFVRNPYDRFLSFWKQKIRVENKFTRSNANPFKAGMTFPETVNVVCNIQDDHSDIHFKSQLAQVEIDGLLPIFLGKLECVDKDWEELDKYLEEPLPILPFENRTPDYRSEWDDNLRDKIYTRFQRDFRILGYDK